MSEEIGKTIFQQVMNIWIIPELEKRKKEKSIDEKFILSKAQIVFSLGREPRVRINNEVKAIMEVKINKSVKKGEPIYEKDITEIKNIKLNDNINYSHITLFRFKNEWIIAFDAQNNKKIRKEYLDAAKEFYESAINNLNKKRLRAFYDNAYSSAELCTISILLFNLNKKIIDNKKHSQWYGFFKNFTNPGNAKSIYPETLKKLWGLRKSARYLSSTLFKKENHKEIKSILKEMIDYADNFLS